MNDRPSSRLWRKSLAAAGARLGRRAASAPAQVAGASVPASACRRGLRRADRQAVALRAARRTGGGGGAAISRPRADARRRSPPRRACARARRPGWRSTRACSSPPCSRSEQSGPHLCHAMLLPKPEAQALLPKFVKDGRIELPGASIERRGKAAMLTFRNPRFLNAEDQTTLDGMETCVDLALARSADRSRGAARHGGRASEVQGPARVRRRHQPHASLSRPDSVPLVSRARPRLRQQALSRPGAARRRAAGRVRRPDHREAVDRGGGDPSPSAAIARFCWRSTTCWPRRPRS